MLWLTFMISQNVGKNYAGKFRIISEGSSLCTNNTAYKRIDELSIWNLYVFVLILMSQVYLIKFKHIKQADFKIFRRPSLENSKPLCKIGRSSGWSYPIKLFLHCVLLAVITLESL